MVVVAFILAASSSLSIKSTNRIIHSLGNGCVVVVLVVVAVVVVVVDEGGRGSA